MQSAADFPEPTRAERDALLLMLYTAPVPLRHACPACYEHRRTRRLLLNPVSRTVECPACGYTRRLPTSQAHALLRAVYGGPTVAEHAPYPGQAAWQRRIAGVWPALEAPPLRRAQSRRVVLTCRGRIWRLLLRRGLPALLRRLARAFAQRRQE